MSLHLKSFIDFSYDSCAPLVIAILTFSLDFRDGLCTVQQFASPCKILMMILVTLIFCISNDHVNPAHNILGINKKYIID